MILMMAGDIHGDYNHCKYLVSKCVEFGVNNIFVLGDFGYWEHYSSGKYFLDTLNKLLIQENIQLFWLDGNHENHPLLWDMYGNDPDDFVVVRSNIRYSPRGHRWEWDGVKFLSLGGAYSIDKEWREKGTEWWPTEMITEADVEACSTEEVDVLLCHDVGMDVDLSIEFAIQRRSFFKADTSTLINRHRLQMVIDAINPSYIWHGHYHLRYNQKVHGREYVGLNCNGCGGDSFTIVDLKDLVVHNGSSS